MAEVERRGDLVKALEALQARADAGYRALIEHVPAVMYVVSLGDESECTYISPQVETMLGYTPEEWMDVPEPWGSRIHPDDKQRVLDLVERCTEACEPFHAEYRLLGRDGAECHVRDQAVSVRGPDGRPRFAHGVMFDITEQRRAERQRQDLERQVQHAQKLESLGVLAGGIAHDFNNILVGILGNASLALMDLGRDHPAREVIEDVVASAKRAAELANQMLTYSGQGKFIISPLSLTQLVRTMHDLLRSSISKSARLELDLRGDAPLVLADSGQLRQVVLNLVVNASEALGDAEGTITLRTGAVEADRADLDAAHVGRDLPAGTYGFLEVQDTGCGMEQTTLDRIFDPFFSTKFAGRGLGLAANLGVVRGHAGTFVVDSEKGEGTTVRVLLPTAETEEAPATETHESPELSAEGQGRTVLVVDDEAVVINVSKRVLSKAGFEVLTARDGREAVKIFREKSAEIDVVVLDLTMPGMDGQQTYRALADVRPDVPVLISSGYSASDVAARFGGDGPSGFIHKPYRPEELVQRVRSALS